MISKMKKTGNIKDITELKKSVPVVELVEGYVKIGERDVIMPTHVYYFLPEKIEPVARVIISYTPADLWKCLQEARELIVRHKPKEANAFVREENREILLENKILYTQPFQFCRIDDKSFVKAAKCSLYYDKGDFRSIERILGKWARAWN